jgi:ankyrin repeat protein
MGAQTVSALQAASRWGHVETVRLLLENGADVNAAGGPYGSALKAALRMGHVETVRLFLEKGVDLNAAG